jgi:hypothetical protein
VSKPRRYSAIRLTKLPEEPVDKAALSNCHIYCLDWCEMKTEFCQLKAIPFSPFPKKSAKIDILTGTDYANLITPFKSGHGGKEDPVAVRTRLQPHYLQVKAKKSLLFDFLVL